jgi:glutaredoxin
MAAREACEKEGQEFEYIDVLSAADKLDAMLKHSNGVRKVPVIVEDEKVTIGFKGET